MHTVRLGAVLVPLLVLVACGGQDPVGPTAGGAADFDLLSDATLSMAMVRANPALAPDVDVAAGTFVEGRPHPLPLAPTSGPTLRVFTGAELAALKHLADPAIDPLGQQVNAAYLRHAGDLFAEDLTWDNLAQGYLGDCYFAAALSAVLFADRGGPLTEEMVAPNYVSGSVVSFFVTMFQASGRKVRIEVDPDLPHLGQTLVYMTSLSNGTYEQWAPSLIEKAYAVWHKGYGAIGRGGYAADALFALNGRPTRAYAPAAPMTVDVIEAAGQAGLAQVACTFSSDSGLDYTDTFVYSDHCYALRGVSRHGGKVYVQLRNPWGPTTDTEPPDDGVQDGVFELELSKFQALYASVDVSR
jgi:hypothetical protein